MKVFFTLLISAFTLSSSTNSASIDDVISGLKNGNAAQIAKSFDLTIHLTLPTHSSTYGRNEGETILRDFFTTAIVRSFVILHKGENNGSLYCIGTLSTSAGNFRTTVYLKQKGDRHIVQEMRIETK